MFTTPVTCRVPGKALLVGGYAILDSENRGLVAALDCWFKTRCVGLPSQGKRGIVIVSGNGPYAGRFEYQVTPTGQLETSNVPNPFIAFAVEHVIQFVTSRYPSRFVAFENTILEINLEPDALFYSATGKRGLGSSACLVVSITACLLRVFLQDEFNVNDAHRLAQYSHAAAQQRQGSGFDVACAVYGSHLFSRRALCIDQLSLFEPLHAKPNDICLDVPTSWEFFPHLFIVLAHIEGDHGTNTPGAVRAVQAWKQQSSESQALFGKLVNANESFLEQLAAMGAIARQDREAFCIELELFLKAEESSLESQVATLQHTFLAIRKLLRMIGKQSHVEIEPDCRTTLCDNLMQHRSVLAAGIPGAGGYDDVFLLVLHTGPFDDRLKSHIQSFFSSNMSVDLLFTDVDTNCSLQFAQ